MRYAGSRHPLAAANPLRSIPFLRAARPQLTPEYLAAWELDRAGVVMPSLEKQFVYARQCLGNANRLRGIARRNAQAMAMRFLNRARGQLRAARSRLDKAQAAVAELQAQPMLPFVVAA